jgi:hypothetical protein
MRNVTGKLMDSWWDLLNGSLDNSVPVYVESVPGNAPDNYVILRSEGETEVEKNNKTWIKEAVIIADIVTSFPSNELINTSVVDGIDNEIGVLLMTSPYHSHNLTAQSGMIINRVEDETTQYLQEDDGEKKYYRKLTRYNHLITIQI